MDTFVPPSDCGKRLIPNTIDRIAETEPDKVFGAVPVSNTDLEKGFKDVTYRQISRAIHTVAWWLEKEIGRSDDFETLVYAAPNDFRFSIFAVAACKVGYQTLFTSPRNSVEGHVNLLKKTNCKTMVTTNPPPHFLDALLASHSMRIIHIASQDELLAPVGFTPYPYNKSFEEARNDPFITLHTSGSTGLPKPVTWTHGFFAAIDNTVYAPAPKGTKSIMKVYHNLRLFNAMPAFHAGGLSIQLCFSTFFGTISVLPPSDKPLDAATATLAHQYAQADATFLLPSTIEDITKSPALFEQFKLPLLFSSGGILPRAAGDAIRTKCRLVNMIGATELGVFPHLDLDQEDWDCFSVNPHAGVEFQPRANDLYELVIVRKKECEPYQPTWHVFPDLQKYSMNDLYSPHATKPNTWLHRGRADDVIVFLHGEKLNPITMESIVQSHPEVRGALVTGENHFQSALLVEPSRLLTTVDDRAKMVENLWPFVQKANVGCPSHGKISKAMILFTVPEKPMLRAGKGTVQRRFTIAAYREEIEKLYADAETIKASDASFRIDDSSADSLRSSIKDTLAQVADMRDLDDEEDLFIRGMDSLQVLLTTRHLKTGLNIDDLAPSTIYMNSSVSKLVNAIMALKGQAKYSQLAEETARTDRMQKLLKELTVNLSSQEIPQKTSKGAPTTVVLTGSTGALGSYLLEALLATPKVTKIYCLNRMAGSERQIQISSGRGLSIEWGDRVQFLQSDISKDNLGLEKTSYTELIRETTVIIHNAWKTDFNLPLESFRPLIEGTRSLIQLSARSKNQASVFFVSSIAAVLDWSSHHTGKIPEAAIDDLSVPQAMGYGEAKYVSERLLSEASKKYRISISICRAGQIAGPVSSEKGMWNKQEWLPSLIASSKHLGMIPDSLGAMTAIDWIPIDTLSKIMVELALQDSDHRPLPRVYHTVNPQTTTWSELLPAVLNNIGSNSEVVPFALWVKGLRQSSSSGNVEKELANNPAIKLLEFFEGMQRGQQPLPVFDTSVTGKVSKTMAQLSPVQGRDIELWMRQWNF